jgi:hypothetical protein
MSRLGKIVAALFGVFMLLMAVVQVHDAQEAHEDPQTYERVHDVSTQEYVRRTYWMAALFGQASPSHSCRS